MLFFLREKKKKEKKNKEDVATQLDFFLYKAVVKCC